MSDLQNLRTEARALGIDLSSAKHANAITSRRTRAQQQAAEASIPQLERTAIEIGNFLTTTLILLLRNVAPPFAILFLVVVEINRVHAGIRLFDPSNAWLMSIVAVITYAILTTVKSHLTYKEFGTLEKPRPSLALYAQQVAYFCGFGRNWQKQYTTPLARLEGALWWLGAVIVLLGTLGSMENKLLTVEGTWSQGIASIATRSTLAEAMTYLGGFSFTLALLVALPWVIGYVYTQFAAQRPTQLETGEAADEAEVEYLRAQIIAKSPKPEELVEVEVPFLAHRRNGSTPTASGAANGSRGHV